MTFCNSLSNHFYSNYRKTGDKSFSSFFALNIKELDQFCQKITKNFQKKTIFI